MLDNLKQYLENLGTSDLEGNGGFSDEDVAESIILLMKQMMFADGRVKKTELDTAIEFLQNAYKEDGENSDAAENKLREAEAQSIFPLATILRKSLTKDQLQALRVQLEKIALSDGEFHPFEQDFLVLFDELIGNPASSDKTGA